MATKQEAGFSDAERAAMKERARELKLEAKRGDRRAKGTEALVGAIDEMPPADRDLATKLHEIVLDVAPDLYPKTWYGMPAWTNEDGKVVCFFKAAAKFDGRYAVIGFEDAATLDDGALWPTVFAITAFSEPVERQVTDLVKRAVAG